MKYNKIQIGDNFGDFIIVNDSNERTKNGTNIWEAKCLHCSKVTFKRTDSLMNKRNRNICKCKKMIYKGRCYYISMGYYYNKELGQLHRNIWEDIYGKIPEGYVIHHINGKKTDNNPCNLQLMSNGEHTKHHNTGKKHSLETLTKMKENIKYDSEWRVKHKNNCERGNNHHNSKLNYDKVKEIKTLIEKGLSCKEIGELYNVNRTTIGDIKAGRTWI